VFLAYIDPGAGSMVIQAILAAALAVPFVLRSQITRLIARVRSGRTERTSASRSGPDR
jgi:hypothetical protein